MHEPPTSAPAIFPVATIIKHDTAKIIEDAGQGGASDLDIATEYQDLLLSLACAEAYLDINQVDAVAAYKQDVTEQLALMANMSKTKETKDETKET